jgi:hypothetical protein
MPTETTVSTIVSETVVVTETNTQVLEVVTQGPQGAKGERGDAILTGLIKIADAIDVNMNGSPNGGILVYNSSILEFELKTNLENQLIDSGQY